MQRLLIQLPDSRPTVLADRAVHFDFTEERLLATHARLRLLCELHQPAQCRGRDTNRAGMLAGEELAGLFLTEDRLEDADEGFGELVVKVVFGVDRDVVLKNEDWVLGALVVLCATGAFDDNVGNAVAEGGRRAGVALLHALCELDVRLLSGVVALGEGFGDDEFRHVYFVL